MDKAEIEAILERSFTWPQSQVSGEYLAEHVIRDAQHVLSLDRDGLLAVLRDWLRTYREPHTSLALQVAEHLHLCDLEPDILALRQAVAAGKAFKPYYTKLIDRSLATIEQHRNHGRRPHSST